MSRALGRVTIRAAQEWSRHLTASCRLTKAGLVVVVVGIGLSLFYGSVTASLFQLLRRLVLPLTTKSTHKSYELGLLVGLEDT